jgi:hypothetical protein
MGRKSETRERVREIADDLAGQGIVPSSRKILELLGKGSLTTIQDELEAWQRGPKLSHDAAAPPVATADEDDKTDMPGATGTAILELLTSRLAELLSITEKTNEELTLVRAELGDLKKTHQEQLDTAYKRYEAVQRHALLQVDEARQNAAQLRERVKTLTSELDTREMAHSGKLQAVREENARLRGMLEAVGLTAEASPRR